MRPLKQLLALLALVFGLGLNGQMIKYPDFTCRPGKTAVKTGETIEIILTTSNIPATWHLFSEETDCPPEEGPVEASLEFTPHPGYQLVGKLSSIGDHLVRDDIFGCSTGQFEGKAEFRQKIKILSPDAVIRFRFLGQMCTDVTGMCVPVKSPLLEVKDLKITGAAQETPVAETPAPTAPTVDTSKQNPLPAPAVAALAPAGKPGYQASGPNEAGTCKPKTFGGSIPVQNQGLGTLFLLAFVSGLLGLITPCVFPMIPMTVTFFMKTKNRAVAIREALVFAFSIIAIYTVLGTLVAFAFGADAGNWISTHWIPNLFFFVIFLVFAASFFGAFELILPASLVNKVDRQADKGGILGPVFMALTIALVSFSCTGPIVGTVLAQSITGNFLTPVVGMFGFSLAFALPFGLFALFPSWLNSLPKSGGWLNSVKVILGFLEVAFALKFLSIADQTYHWRLLDREVYLALWIAIFTLMGLYLLGKIRFAHDSEAGPLGIGRLSLVIATFSFVVYLIPGMWGAPLKFLAGYLPPMHTQDFDINRSIREAAGLSGNVIGKPRYADQLHLPHGLVGYFDYDEALAASRELKKPLFIDFTGHGCVNCRKMEEMVWSHPSVLKLLREEFVIASLYVDDHKIKLPAEEQFYSRWSGEKITELGAKNADIELCYFGANAQPLYILLDGNEDMLQPAGSAESFNYKPEAFTAFLEAGLKNFKLKQAIKP